MRKFGFDFRCATLSSLPVTRLSSTSTSQPRDSINSLKCDPKNPAPPVITARTYAPRRLIAGLSSFASSIIPENLGPSQPHNSPPIKVCAQSSPLLRVAASLIFRRHGVRRVIDHDLPPIRKFLKIQREVS